MSNKNTSLIDLMLTRGRYNEVSSLPASAFDSSRVVSTWIEHVKARPSQDSILRVLRDQAHVLPSNLSQTACKLFCEQLGDTYGSALLAGTQNDQVRVTDGLSHKFKSVRLATLWNPLVSPQILLDKFDEVIGQDIALFNCHPLWLDWLADPDNVDVVSKALLDFILREIPADWRNRFSRSTVLVELWRNVNEFGLDGVEVVYDLDTPRNAISKGHIKKAASFIRENRIPANLVAEMIPILFERHPSRVLPFLETCRSERAFEADGLSEVYVAAFNAGVTDPSVFSPDMSNALFTSLEVDAVLSLLKDSDFDISNVMRLVDREDRLDVFNSFVDRFASDSLNDFSVLLTRWFSAGFLYKLWFKPGYSATDANSMFDPSSLEYAVAVDNAVAVLDRVAGLNFVVSGKFFDDLAPVIHDDAMVRYVAAKPLLRFFVNNPGVAFHVFGDLSISQAVNVLAFEREVSPNSRMRFNNWLPSVDQLVSHANSVVIMEEFFASKWNNIVSVSQSERTRLLLINTIGLLALQGDADRIQGLLDSGVARFSTEFNQSVAGFYTEMFKHVAGEELVKNASSEFLIDFLKMFYDADAVLAEFFKVNAAFVSSIVIELVDREDFSAHDALFVSNIVNVLYKSMDTYASNAKTFIRLTLKALEDQPEEIWETVAFLSPNWQGTIPELLDIVGCVLPDSPSHLCSQPSPVVDVAESSQLNLM